LYHEESDYYYWRAQVYEKLKQYLKASKDIGRAYQLAPTDTDVQKGRKWLASKLIYDGHELAERGKADSAINYYNAAPCLNPDDGDVYYRRARASVDLHRYDSALLDLQRAIQIDPNKFGYYQSLDWILAKRRDWDRIIVYWSRYTAMHPDNSRAYVERGGVYYHKGDMRSAVADAKAAADMGNDEGKEAYEKFKDRAD
jgi:tetratricopeptide (TPR) repeat protein